MSKINDIRKAIKRELPFLRFKVHTVSFTDLARTEHIFVESPEWGMTKGNHEVYKRVKTICEPFDVIVSW